MTHWIPFHHRKRNKEIILSRNSLLKKGNKNIKRIYSRGRLRTSTGLTQKGGEICCIAKGQSRTSDCIPSRVTGTLHGLGKLNISSKTLALLKPTGRIPISFDTAETLPFVLQPPCNLLACTQVSQPLLSTHKQHTNKSGK